MYNRRFAVIIIFSLFFASTATALDLSDPYIDISNIFEPFIDVNEGLTSFRSLLVPGGGRSEAMGSAFCALANDISFFETNPAGSSTMKNTELAVFHNNWIADSRLETVSVTSRTGNFGYGASFRCFYVPFTEYNTFGERVSRGYYSETFAVLNASYNFLAGYYFKGIAVGANLKAGYRYIPDYSDNYGNLKSGSGFEQSAVAVMGDIGFQTQFNLLKLYNSRDSNFFLGLTFRNFGPPVMKEPLPSVITFGTAYKPANPITISAEIQKPINLSDPALSGTMIYGAGIIVDVASFFSFLGGIQLKGANPRISIGGEINVGDMQFNINYTLDMTTQAALFNRISLAAKLNLGDKGRAERARRVEEIYIEGLKLYASGDLEAAIAQWNKSLAIDKRFDPAKEGIETARITLSLQKKIREIQQLE
ncbi:MAG TPA: UPF0164 family protein [Treponema sp.]|nr:UPF0164 family protein [Treponema sp.]